MMSASLPLSAFAAAKEEKDGSARNEAFDGNLALANWIWRSWTAIPDSKMTVLKLSVGYEHGIRYSKALVRYPDGRTICVDFSRFLKREALEILSAEIKIEPIPDFLRVTAGKLLDFIPKLAAEEISDDPFDRNGVPFFVEIQAILEDGSIQKYNVARANPRISREMSSWMDAVHEFCLKSG